MDLSPLDQHPLALLLRGGLYPLLETLHIIGLASFFGSLLLVELALLRILPRVDAVSLARSALPWSLAGFALAAASGMFLFIAHASELIANPAFRLKLLLILLAGCNAAWLHSRGPLDPDSLSTRLQALLSLMIWLAVIACGRWIAYI